jgi:DNA-directed RNA polymerase subunit RPC12/RpoP
VVYYDCEHCGSRLFNYEPGEGGKCPNCGAQLIIINQFLVQPRASSVAMSASTTASTATQLKFVTQDGETIYHLVKMTGRTE